MFVSYHGFQLIYFIILSLLLKYGITLSPFSEFKFSTNLCTNIPLQNLSFGVIHSLNFYSGQSQPPNTSCSWIISNPQALKWSNYILSLRVIELEDDPTHWSNELTLWTGSRQISIDDINKRTYILSTSSSIQIFFRTKPPLLQTFNPYIRTNLRIRRFLIEFTHINNDAISTTSENYFRCLSSGILIPKQWRWNCINECSYEDYSDENNVQLCSMNELTNGLLCQSNENWCLPDPSKSINDNLMEFDYDDDDWMAPHINYSRKIDPKGVCIPHDEPQTCLYSTNKSNCERILVWRQDNGKITLSNSLLDNYQSLCFIIIAKEEYKIKLFVNQNRFSRDTSDIELVIYDGSEQQDLILASLANLSHTHSIQTRQHHIATMIVRKHSVQSLTTPANQNDDDYDVFGYLDSNKGIQKRDTSSVLLNITWITTICADDQILCGGHFETKCYTKQQRCDGIWDCINGDDEIGCSPESCPTTFACNDRLRLPSDLPRCFTWAERCNGNAFCTNRTDEKFCSSWWCNSNNGTFLCKNLNCIYETWVCDGTDDCGDRSDEINCPSRLPRRIVTAAVIGATVCSTLFIIALGCTCKLFHLRTAERRATSRLLNPQHYIEQRRQEIQREQERLTSRRNRQQTSMAPTESSTTLTNEARRIAPPSYNQTMGLMDENEERQAALAEHLRLAGLANYVTLPLAPSSLRVSRSTSRHRHRRHRRHRHHHHHHHRRANSEGSRVALLEPSVVVPNDAFPTRPSSFSSNRFNRFRSQIYSLFTTNRSNSNNDDYNNSILTQPTSSPINVYDRPSLPTIRQPLVFLAPSQLNSAFVRRRELPPPYAEEQFTSSESTTMTTSRRSSNASGSEHETTNPTTTISSLYRIRKQQMPINTLRDRMRQFISNSTVRGSTDDLNHPTQPTTTTLNANFEEQPPVASTEKDEHPCSDDDKMLTP